MSRDPSLNGMIYFESVARNGRVARAAEELNVSPSAVSQQIKLLEELLGISLFRREKRQLSLTAEGEQLYLATTSAFGILHNARQLISRHRDSHQLIIRVSPSFAIRWLSPKLADFIQKHPEWDLRVDASPDPSNFEREVVDFDIRYGHSSLAGLHCEEVVSDYILPICSPAYRDELRRTCNSPLEMLQKMRLVDSIKAVIQWDNWLARHRITRNTQDTALRFDRSSMAIQQAINGVGVVLESTTLTYDELTSGTLVPLVPEMGAIRFPAYRIVCPSRHHSRKLVQVFINWILQQAEAHESHISRLLNETNTPIYDDPEVFSYLSATKP